MATIKNSASRKENDPFHPIRVYAKRVNEDLHFTSEGLSDAENYYVGWLDLMGAGHWMNISVQKTANFLARLHMAFEIARKHSNNNLHTLPINDGIFIVGKQKGDVMSVIRHALVLLCARFIGTPRPHDRCLMKGAIAFGPVYLGQNLAKGIKTRSLRENPQFLDRILFGPPIIQAYRAEGPAPPYGIAIHESARAFAAQGSPPFRMTHWLWWQEYEEASPVPRAPPLTVLKELLLSELETYYNWMNSSLLFQGVSADKVETWRLASRQYFSMG